MGFSAVYAGRAGYRLFAIARGCISVLRFIAILAALMQAVSEGDAAADNCRDDQPEPIEERVAGLVVGSAGDIQFFDMDRLALVIDVLMMRDKGIVGIVGLLEDNQVMSGELGGIDFVIEIHGAGGFRGLEGLGRGYFLAIDGDGLAGGLVSPLA